MNAFKINLSGGIYSAHFNLGFATWYKPAKALFLLLFCVTLTKPGSINAQPSGGPYGPLTQHYSLSDVQGKIYYVSPDGKSEATGENISQPSTLESVIERVVTDDAIILRGGIYRTGNLVFNQGITLQAYANEQPVLKGTCLATNWKNLGNGLWTTHWEKLFPESPADWWQRDRQGKATPLHRFNNDMVFADGKFLQSAGWEGEVDENSYYIDYGTGTVYIGTDPSVHEIEITTYDVALLRVKGKCHGRASDQKGPVIRGITFTQYAYRAIEVEGTEPEGLSPESAHGKEVTGTLLEHCTISFCSRVAAYLRGDGLIIRHCKISDTSTEGIYIISSSDVLLEKNIFTRNNIEYITGYYPAAVKIFNQCYRVTCSDNLVIEHPFSNGIWYDVGNVDGIFINNWVQGVGSVAGEIVKERPWPSDNGFFFEISKGTICAGNVFVNCDHGLWILNSSDAQIYQNTFINSTACIGRDGRRAEGDHFGWHPSTGPDVDKREGHEFVNNLLYADAFYKHPLLYVWQNSAVCERLKNQQLIKFDYNAFIDNRSKGAIPMILWGPSANQKCQEFFDSPLKLHEALPEFSAHCQADTTGTTLFFQSPELGNYRPIHSFGAAAVVPDDIKQLIGIDPKTLPYIGAYAGM
jgi:hypothetical protein